MQVWSIFQKVMCRSVTWRPRWGDALESWQCISSSAHVLAIPIWTEPQSLWTYPAQVGGVLLSVTRKSQIVRRILCGRVQPWPRRFRPLVIPKPLLQLDLPLNDETVSWINIFWTISGNRSLTATIRDKYRWRFYLPLRVDANRLDVRGGSCSLDWISFTANGRLFVHDVATGPWLSLLCDLASPVVLRCIIQPFVPTGSSLPPVPLWMPKRLPPLL